MTTPDARRERWQRSADHKIAHGFHVETDPAFLSWIEEWIAGNITIKEVQTRYAALLMSRDKAGISTKHQVVTALIEQIGRELPGAADDRI
ncbi:hypothetical protein [Pararhizobium gei]|uniref:hypothetical protein n=1 Tax=Pararhizobium gei TaxID=1395951 RepID=UPI0023DB293E|nr:hypothetical protein [Rhizobium gei]